MTTAAAPDMPMPDDDTVDTAPAAEAAETPGRNCPKPGERR